MFWLLQKNEMSQQSHVIPREDASSGTLGRFPTFKKCSMSVLKHPGRICSPESLERL